MEPGDTVVFAGHTIVYVAPFQRAFPSKTSTGVRLEVTLDDGNRVVMEPTHNFFPGQPNGVATPAVHSGASGDLYVMLITLDGGTATIELDTSPLMWLLWVGGLTVATGGFWSFRTRRSERRALAEPEPVRV